MPTYPIPEGMKQINVHVLETDLDRLDVIAAMDGMTRAAKIRHLIKREIRRQGASLRREARRGDAS
jgi:hypothetical protein